MKKKYIIALEDRNVWSCGVPAKTLLLSDVSIFGTDLASVNTGIELTPYTEPDFEQVRKEAYEEGYAEGSKEDYDEAYLKGYNQGLADAWDAARKIVDCAIPYEALENYLEIGECTADVIKHLPASKAIEVVRQYEQEKEEIHVGDEVKGKYGTTAGMLGIVTRLDDALQNYNVVWSDGSTICFTGYRERGDVVKTGRHFPEIAAVLERMREDAT